MQADESDEVFPDQYPCPGNWALAAVVVATQCQRPCLCVVSVDPGKDFRITASPIGLECPMGHSRFHQDDRQRDFLRINSPEGVGMFGDRDYRPMPPLHNKGALSSW